MYKITEKVALNPTVTKMVIEAPLIAKKAKPGQFIIVRPFEDSERIPLTVAGYDREKGTVDIIFQIVGGTTMELNSLEVGQSVHDFVGPLGRATEVEGLKKVCVVGGGVGCAIALPIARELHEQGCVVHSVVGFRSKDLLILEDEFKACSDELRIMTDDGSYGTKGVVTAALDELVAAGNGDEDFGKRDEYMVPIEAPCYAVPRGANNIDALVDGLWCDGNFQCLDVDMKPIEGLFAVGNASGPFFGNSNYPMDIEGLSVGRAITTGFATGRYVAGL